MMLLCKAVSAMRVASKSPGLAMRAGHAVGQVAVHALGSTQSGKKIMSHPEHTSHESFGKTDHMDAYRAHAQHLSKLGNDVHPNVIEHHRQAMNHHFGKGVGAKLEKARREHIGKTRSGHKIHRHSHKDPAHHAGWSAHDHHDAMHAHHKRADSIMKFMGHLAKKGKKLEAFSKLAADHADAAHYHHSKHQRKR
jgi:hypothetical protein